jgi:hypothetical protein
MLNKKQLRSQIIIAILGLSAAKAALAATADEIQVYDDASAKVGAYELAVHVNHVMSGTQTPAWPGDAPSDHSSRITPEIAYGLNEHWDWGGYLPLLRESNGNTHLEGAKLRLKYVSAPKDSAFYWGLNGELGVVSVRSADHSWNTELRPILGYRGEKWHFTLNPIVGWTLASGQSRVPDFSPAFRASYALKEDLSVSLEHYADLGKLNNILPGDQQGHTTYAVVDTTIAGYDLNFGIGRGNANADKWTVKAIIGVPLSK